MSKRIWSIALAYIGVMIGAGVSSGQDLLQYFVSFGVWGLCYRPWRSTCWFWPFDDFSRKLLPF